MHETLKIAVSGLSDAIARLVNLASNVVNVSSTARLPQKTEDSYSGYIPHDVVTISSSVADHNLGVQTQLKPREPAYVPAPDPHSPNANSEGLVAVPNVDLATEFVNAKMAEIAYKANAAVIRAEQKNGKELLDTLA